MYRQIELHSCDIPYQRISWRFDLYHHHHHNHNHHIKSFYVDDCLSGAQTIEEAIQLRDQLIELLQRGGFSLRKFASNKLAVLQGLEPEQIATQSTITFTEHETVKASGVTLEP